MASLQGTWCSPNTTYSLIWEKCLRSRTWGHTSAQCSLTVEIWSSSRFEICATNLTPIDESFDKKMLAGNYENQTSALFICVAIHLTKTSIWKWKASKSWLRDDMTECGTMMGRVRGFLRKRPDALLTKHQPPCCKYLQGLMLDLLVYECHLWAFWGDSALLILCHKKLFTDKMKRTAPERFASELCCVSNIFAFSNWKEQNFFRQLTASLRGTCILSVFLVQVKLGSAKKMDPPKTQIFVHHTVNASGTWEVKGVMKLSRLSLFGSRKCCKNAKGQRYLGVGENNSLGLAFRNICSQLPREVSNC